MRHQPSRHDAKAFAKALQEAQSQCLNLRQLAAKRDQYLATLKA